MLVLSFNYPKPSNRASGCLPEHDVLVTNPPYTADHVERFLRFAVDNGKPWLLLVPD